MQVAGAAGGYRATEAALWRRPQTGACRAHQICGSRLGLYDARSAPNLGSSFPPQGRGPDSPAPAARFSRVCLVVSGAFCAVPLLHVLRRRPPRRCRRCRRRRRRRRCRRLGRHSCFPGSCQSLRPSLPRRRPSSPQAAVSTVRIRPVPQPPWRSPSTPSSLFIDPVAPALLMILCPDVDVNDLIFKGHLLLPRLPLISIHPRLPAPRPRTLPLLPPPW
jgi:hypothetical protein